MGQPPRPQHGYINVRIDLSTTRFSLNKKISIPCTVNSYSAPTVSWKHQGRPLRPSQRVQVLRNNNTLIIYNGRETDSGRYTCEAENGYKRDSDSVDITVANVVVPQDCTDNPYFANCKLIVKAGYCDN